VISIASCELESLVCFTSWLLKSESADFQADNERCLQEICRRMETSPLSPERLRLKENLVHCYVQSGDVEGAAVLLEELNGELTDMRPDLLLLYADLTAQFGDVEASNEVLRILSQEQSVEQLRN
jgi:hypothetical protein